MTRINIGDSRVVESREVSDGLAIRRRRETPDGRRFTTYERIEKPNITVQKKSGKRESFSRQKLLSAVNQSVGTFFQSEEEVDQIVSSIEEALYALGESEVESKRIGDLVLDALADRNEVAYVRFASVYHDFTSLDEFEEILVQRQQRKQQNSDHGHEAEAA